MSDLVRMASISLVVLVCVEAPSLPPFFPTLEKEIRPNCVGRRSTAREEAEGPTLGRMRLAIAVGPILLFSF